VRFCVVVGKIPDDFAFSVDFAGYGIKRARELDIAENAILPHETVGGPSPEHVKVDANHNSLIVDAQGEQCRSLPRGS
jgi:hypothetical protein